MANRDNNPGISLKTTFSLEDKDFIRLSSFINHHFGIKLPPNKKTLLQCRLQKRIKLLQLKSFREYTDYVLSSNGLNEEVTHMIDAVSTNKTDFFREPIHFDFLMNQGIKNYLDLTGKRKISVWSAGCSSGEEPYTIAMVFKEYAATVSNFDFEITATDIADSVLQHAMLGIYQEEKTEVIPYNYKKKYLLKGKNEFEHKLKVRSELREKIDFRKFNLLSTDYSVLGRFDIIFCRNVLIYFEREVQYRILDQFCRVLNKGGYLFLGHSESINGYALPLQHIKPTIFTKLAQCRY
jgi:chemotaxis protein methyltransferase CheR